MDEEEKYNPEGIATFYDECGEREWKRFSKSLADRVNLLIHTHYLRHFGRRGSRVFEVGGGPGHFTQVLADLGCRVVMSDLSPVQLELHRKYTNELGFDDAVESRLLRTYAA